MFEYTKIVMNPDDLAAAHPLNGVEEYVSHVDVISVGTHHIHVRKGDNVRAIPATHVCPHDGIHRSGDFGNLLKIDGMWLYQKVGGP